MIITEHINPMNKEKSYNIMLGRLDLEPIEIVECFTKQYPKEIAVITYSKIKVVEMGIILIGLNLNGNLK